MSWWGRFWGRRVPNGSGEYREFVEHRLEVTKNMTPLYERLASHIQDLPDDQLADRLRRALRRP